jgi:hypothetical protein
VAFDSVGETDHGDWDKATLALILVFSLSLMIPQQLHHESDAKFHLSSNHDDCRLASGEGSILSRQRTETK